jgi:hypothetical protein
MWLDAATDTSKPGAWMWGALALIVACLLALWFGGDRD